MKTTQVKKYESKRIALPGEVVKPAVKTRSFFERVKSYIDRQQASENHFKWPGIVMATQAFAITPLLSVVVIATGNWIPLWFAITASMYATYIPVLAGLSVRKIMTMYFINLVVSALIIVMAVAHFMVA